MYLDGVGALAIDAERDTALKLSRLNTWKYGEHQNPSDIDQVEDYNWTPMEVGPKEVAHLLAEKSAREETEPEGLGAEQDTRSP